jgi:hypothetical protein
MLIDGQTSMTKLISAFRNFAYEPKKGTVERCICALPFETTGDADCLNDQNYNISWYTVS